MTGVLKGRRLRITRADDSRYDVLAVAGEVGVLLGQVERITISTDSRIAGTRLRRPGKGRAGWRAIVPRADFDGGRGELTMCFVWGHWRVERVGSDFGRRQDAVDALVQWHDHPERRETPDSR